MDGSSSLETRYSFNMVRSNPVAESTHLNGSSFCWGSSSLLSSKQRSNSSFCLNNTKNDSRIFLTSPNSKNTTKIDARIVADVQSKGLASRIVKYHETGTRLNRSMSAHNLYTKPGQFPVVNLKKTQLPYRATKHNLSMTRIAPPETSLFYGKTLSSLLRSNSVVGLQKTNDDFSHENRPILHYPPTENEMAPTRSVLDELKEISRKRINSDDLETTETSKKYCNRVGNDLIDTAGVNATHVPPHLSASSKSFKRQREINALQQSKQIQELQISPEQAKKRLCNYNNDITSSLSSSIKCKSYERKRPSTYYLNQTMPTNLESYENQRAKVQRYYDEHNTTQDDLRCDHLANNLRKEDNTTKPISTPSTQEQVCNNGVAPQRTASEPLHKFDDKKTTLNSIQPANKPRLTLFNKNYDVAPDRVVEQENDLSDSEGDCAGIQFVKPKKLTSKTGIKNPVIERTHKSKLALMLSGLRGELYQISDSDELDSLKTLENGTKVSESNNDNIKKAEPVKTSPSLNTTLNNTINKGIQISSGSTSLTTDSTVASSPSANTKISTPPKSSATNTSSPLVGLKLTPQKTTTVEVTKSLETPVKSSVPVLGGFSFGTTNTTLTPTLAITPTTNNSAKETFAVSGFDKLTKSPSTTAITDTTKAPVINFSATPAKDNAVSNGQSSNTLAGVSAVTTTTSAIASNISNTLTTSKLTPAFSFGTSPLAAVTPNNAITKTDNSATLDKSTKANASFNFGMNSSNTPVFGSSASAAATTVTTNAPSSNTFSFGSNSTSTTALSAVAATTTANTATSNTFSFGPNSTAPPTSSALSAVAATTTANTATSNTFSFGPNSTAPQTSSTVPVFGAPASTATNNLTSTSFSFGTSLSPQATNTTNSKNETSSGGFSFGINSSTQDATSTANISIKPQSTNSKTTTPFSFGSTSTGSNTGQSSAVSNNTSSVFNSNVSSVAPSVFGATSPPVFGASATQGSVFGTAAANSVTNVFGTSNAATTSIFGAAASNNNPPSFGSSTDNKSTSVFGNSTTANNTSTPFGFGSKTTEKPASPPVFGSSTDNKSTSVFGSSSFSFGSKIIDKPIESATSGGFSFGSTAANTKTENKPADNTGGFSFGSALAGKPSNSSTFSFGSSGNASSTVNPLNTASSNNVTGFAFGGAAASSKPADSSTIKPFSFGTATTSSAPQTLAAPNNNSSTNIFGSAAGVVKPASPAFNFGTTTNIQSNAVVPATNNIFAPQPSASTIPSSPGSRPIRRATRRLQK